MITCLIIDDSSFSRHIMSKVLHSIGYAVDEVDGGQLGLDAVHHGEYDLVFLNLNMPDVDGFDVLEELHITGHHPPVVVVTANIDEQSRSRCYSLGAAGFVNTPLFQHEHKVRSLIETVLV